MGWGWDFTASSPVLTSSHRLGIHLTAWQSTNTTTMPTLIWASLISLCWDPPPAPPPAPPIQLRIFRTWAKQSWKLWWLLRLLVQAWWLVVTWWDCDGRWSWPRGRNQAKTRQIQMLPICCFSEENLQFPDYTLSPIKCIDSISLKSFLLDNRLIYGKIFHPVKPVSMTGTDSITRLCVVWNVLCRANFQLEWCANLVI